MIIRHKTPQPRTSRQDHQSFYHNCLRDKTLAFILGYPQLIPSNSYNQTIQSKPPNSAPPQPISLPLSQKNQRYIYLNYQIILTVNTLKFKFHTKYQNYLKMKSQPNIIITYPNHYETEQTDQDGSPIRKFNSLVQMENLMSQFYLLMQGQEQISSSQEKIQKEKGKKKLSIGEKIKNKLESTNNKSFKTNTNENHNKNVCEFRCGNNQTPHATATYAEKTNTIGCNTENNDKPALAKSSSLIDINILSSSINSLSSSIFQNISANTDQSSAPLHNPHYNNNPSTPIQELNNLTNRDSTENKIKQLNFQSLGNGISEFVVEDWRKSNQEIIPITLQHQTKQEQPINMLQTPITPPQIKNSITPFDNLSSPFPIKVVSVDSLCIPYSSSMKFDTSGYDYAIKQLDKLKANVENLQNVTEQLINLKNMGCSARFARQESIIKKSDNQLDESISLFFQQNIELMNSSQSETLLKNIVIKNDKEQLLMPKPPQFVYQTPSQSQQQSPPQPQPSPKIIPNHQPIYFNFNPTTQNLDLLPKNPPLKQLHNLLPNNNNNNNILSDSLQMKNIDQNIDHQQQKPLIQKKISLWTQNIKFCYSE